jgi:hypothetical protein
MIHYLLSGYMSSILVSLLRATYNLKLWCAKPNFFFSVNDIISVTIFLSSKILFKKF